MNNPVILMLFISILNGSMNCVQHYMTPSNNINTISTKATNPVKGSEVSEWIKCYEAEKNFSFISNFCVIDTLNVTDVFSDEREELVSPVDSAGIVAGYTFVIDREYGKMYGELFIGEENDSLQIMTRLYNRHTGTYNSEIAIPLTPVDFILDGRTFKDCVVIDSLNSCYSGEAAEIIRNKITRYVFSKEYGLIYYRFVDGEEFHRWDL